MFNTCFHHFSTSIKKECLKSHKEEDEEEEFTSILPVSRSQAFTVLSQEHVITLREARDKEKKYLSWDYIINKHTFL